MLTRGTLILLVTMGGLAVFALVIGAYAWSALGEVEMTTHGIIAMTLGIVFTVLVGAGLMGLAFYSSRHGYDDDAD